MSQQGDRSTDDWWNRLYDESAQGTGAGDTLDDHFASAVGAVKPPDVGRDPGPARDVEVGVEPGQDVRPGQDADAGPDGDPGADPDVRDGARRPRAWWEQGPPAPTALPAPREARPSPQSPPRPVDRPTPLPERSASPPMPPAAPAPPVAQGGPWATRRPSPEEQPPAVPSTPPPPVAKPWPAAEAPDGFASAPDAAPAAPAPAVRPPGTVPDGPPPAPPVPPVPPVRPSGAAPVQGRRADPRFPGRSGPGEQAPAGSEAVGDGASSQDEARRPDADPRGDGPIPPRPIPPRPIPRSDRPDVGPGAGRADTPSASAATPPLARSGLARVPDEPAAPARAVGWAGSGGEPGVGAGGKAAGEVGGRGVAGGARFVGDGPPTYDAEPTALAPADPDRLDELVPDTVLDGARYSTYAVRAASVRGDSPRYRGEPRRDALLTARFGDGPDALILVAVASGARAPGGGGGGGAQRAAADACHWIGRAVGRSHSRLSEDIRAGRRADLKSGLQRLTDRGYGKLRVRAAELGLEPDTYTASLRCLLLSADPDCRTRVFFGVGGGGLFRLRDGVWQDLEPASPEPGTSGAATPDPASPPDRTPAGDRLTMKLGIPTPPSPYIRSPTYSPIQSPRSPGTPPAEPFRFRASVARPGDTLLLCSTGLAEPLRGEPALGKELAARWSAAEPPGLAAYLADTQVRVKGYADDRTAVGVWEA